jgi:DUF2075 family protein
MIERTYTTVEEANFYRYCAEVYGLKGFSVSMLGCSVFPKPLTLKAGNMCMSEKIRTEKQRKE